MRKPIPIFDLVDSTRARESWFLRWLGPWLVFLFLSIVFPAAFGALLLLLPNMLSLLLRIKEGWTVETAVAIFYMFGMLSIFLFDSTFDAIKEYVLAVDHLMRRSLSILVIGVSDLGCRGSSLAAALMYLVVAGALFTGGFYFAVYAFNTDAMQSVLLFDGKVLRSLSEALPKFFIAGFLLAYSALALLLPIFSIAVPSWRNMTKRPKLTIHRPYAVIEKIDLIVNIAHLSDLHVNADASDKELSTSEALIAASHHDTDIIALTGDLTDDGSAKSWIKFLALPVVADRDRRVVIVAGNHDLNTWNPSVRRSLWTVDSYRKIEAHRRAYLYLQVAFSVMGDRAWVVCPLSGAVRRFDEVYLQIEPMLRAWDNDEAEGKSFFPADFLASLHPIVVTTERNGSDSKVSCVVWNTIKANRWAYLNSLGELSTDQVARADKLLSDQRFCESPIIHMMHHQIAVPRAPVHSRNSEVRGLKRLHAVGMGLETAENFLAFVRRRSQRTGVLHGHHHKFFVCREARTGTSVVSCPSSKFGTEISFSNQIEAGDHARGLMLRYKVNGVHIDLSDVEPIHLISGAKEVGEASEEA